MQTRRVVVAGTAFGRIYLDAIRSDPESFELAGILASGSAYSAECARRYGVPLYTSPEDVPAYRDRTGAGFDRVLAGFPPLGELLAGARRTGPPLVMPGFQGFFRQSAGPGWVLVGDAGHFKDTTSGQGISDALRQAERLAGRTMTTPVLPSSLAKSLTLTLSVPVSAA